MPAKMPEKCPHCDSTSLYESQANARGGYGPDLLPGLSAIWQSATFRVVVCSECGATQFFADEKARAKLAESSKWRPL
jgi:predicted nucleic-acid-binding Zn-ribbon protein